MQEEVLLEFIPMQGDILFFPHDGDIVKHKKLSSEQM